MIPLLGAGLGMPEAILILVVILLLFGGKRIPDLARSLGQSLSEFRKGRDEGTKPGESESLKTSSASHKPNNTEPKTPGA